MRWISRYARTVCFSRSGRAWELEANGLGAEHRLTLEARDALHALVDVT
jgi:hypothetical protein